MLTFYGPQKRVPRLLIAAALGAAPLLAVGGCAANSVRANASAAKALDQVGVTEFPVGKRAIAPAINATTLNGNRFTLSSTIGNVVVLNVWASWCGPCRSESPALARVSAAFSAQSVRFVGIDEQDDSGLAKKFVSSTGARYPNLVDSTGNILSQLRMLPQAGLPSTLVLDRHGRIAARVIGPATGGQITNLVGSLLKES